MELNMKPNEEGEKNMEMGESNKMTGKGSRDDTTQDEKKTGK